MMNYKTIIDFINMIKDNVKNDRYCADTVLEKDIYNISKSIWNEIDDITNSNLNNLCIIHEYLIDEVCKIHEFEEDIYNDMLFKENLNVKEINTRIKDGKRASDIYTLNDSDYDYYFIGDLHSDDFSLSRIIAQCKFYHNIINKNKIRLVFLGDYVDRGNSHLKMMESILILKYIFPNNIYLLRGNHDGGSISEGKVQLTSKIGADEGEDDYFLLYLFNLSKSNRTISLNFLQKYLDFFNSLCYLALVDNKHIFILAVHGGIPRPRKSDLGYFNHISCISDLTNENIVDNMNRSIMDNMLWSDPYDGQCDLRENSGRFGFTHEQFEDFRKVIGFDVLLRGHEAEENGFKKFFNDRLITIFSSGMILEDNQNINNVTAYENVTPQIINLLKNGELKIIPMI